jgi:hypothetical protein
MAVQLTEEQKKRVINPTLQMVSNILNLVGATVGLYGCFWVVSQYRNGKILRNSAGLIILVISITDIFCSLYHVYRSIESWTKFYRESPVRENYAYFNGAVDSMYLWSVIASSHLLLTLAAQTFYVLRGGSNQKLLKYRWILILFGILGPILYFFVPLAFITSQPIFGIDHL